MVSSEVEETTGLESGTNDAEAPAGTCSAVGAIELVDFERMESSEGPRGEM